MGYWDSADRMLFESIVRQERHYQAIFQQANPHYQKNYTPQQRARYRWRYYGSRLSSVVWGYGLQPRRALLSLAVSILIYSLVLYQFDQGAYVAEEFIVALGRSFEAAVSGMMPFVALRVSAGAIELLDQTPMLIRVIGALVGLSYFGMFLSILFERVRRG